MAAPAEAPHALVTAPSAPTGLPTARTLLGRPPTRRGGGTAEEAGGGDGSQPHPPPGGCDARGGSTCEAESVGSCGRIGRGGGGGCDVFGRPSPPSTDARRGMAPAAAARRWVSRPSSRGWPHGRPQWKLPHRACRHGPHWEWWPPLPPPMPLAASGTAAAEAAITSRRAPPLPPSQPPLMLPLPSREELATGRGEKSRPPPRSCRYPQKTAQDHPTPAIQPPPRASGQPPLNLSTQTCQSWWPPRPRRHFSLSSAAASAYLIVAAPPHPRTSSTPPRSDARAAFAHDLPRTWGRRHRRRARQAAACAHQLMAQPSDAPETHLMDAAATGNGQADTRRGIGYTASRAAATQTSEAALPRNWPACYTRGTWCGAPMRRPIPRRIAVCTCSPYSCRVAE